MAENQRNQFDISRQEYRESKNMENINNNLSLLEEDIQKNEKKYLFILFLIGAINNTGYVMVGTASQDIANRFDMSQYMSLFWLSLIVLSGVMRSINSKFFIKIPHKKRIFVMIVLQISAFSILTISTRATMKWGFYTCLLGSVLCGAMQAFGESVMLGYIKVFPTRLVAGWSSGTGFAGPFGSGLVLVLKGSGIDLSIVFMIMIPIISSYGILFMWYERRRIKYLCSDDNRKEEGIIGMDSAASSDLEYENTFSVQTEKHRFRTADNDGENDAKNNKKLSIKNIQHVMPKMFKYAINLGLVYFLEYVIESGWADRAHPKDSDKIYDKNFQGFLEQNAFVILCFCYQIGVFLSRSSLYLFKVRRVYIMTLLQAMNFSWWIYISVSKSVNIMIQIPCMVLVGLLGGAAYVNVNYLLLNEPSIERNEKELAMNICSIFNDTGVLLSSLFVLFIDKFY